MWQQMQQPCQSLVEMAIGTEKMRGNGRLLRGLIERVLIWPPVNEVCGAIKGQDLHFDTGFCAKEI